MCGGTTVDSEEQARELRAMPELAECDVAAGDEVELPPCLPDHYLVRIREETGRPCPRPGIAIDPDNEVALELMHLSIPEHTRHLVEGALRDLTSPAERATVRRRVAAALQDPAVMARLYPPRAADRKPSD